MSIAQGSNTSFYSISTTDPQPFVDFLLELSNNTNPPLVNSVSYGSLEYQIPANISTAFNTIIQKFGARGLTILSSSGDNGVLGYDAGNNPICGYYPQYITANPYVVSVGATQGPESQETEIGCSTATGAIITSGGGFSQIYAMPSYQQTAVTNYLKQPTVPKTGFVATGRGYPDVALMGHNYNIYDGGELIQADGTSCSSPVFAAMITLINGMRISAGKSAVGFLNPVLYSLAVSNPAVFHDITSGLNNCSEEESDGSTLCCTQGFPALEGWDAMTGLGSVNFVELAKAYMNLP